MKFRDRNLRAIAEMIIGDNDKFEYRSSRFITEFFEECDLALVHDGSTRWLWTSERLAELLREPQESPHTLPPRFVHVLRVLMLKGDARDDDPDRSIALGELNKPLSREGFEAFYGDDNILHIRHTGTKTLSIAVTPHRAFTPDEMRNRDDLSGFLDECSDDLIEQVLLPLLRQLGFERVSPAGHKDKALEYGKDVWMRFTLPTQHILYFGLQAKKDKIDAAGNTKRGGSNVAEIHNQLLMMLGHEIFDPETSRKALVDHAFIVAGGEITKQARNWLGSQLDASKRSQVLFMDREDIMNLFIAAAVPMPQAAKRSRDDDLPF